MEWSIVSKAADRSSRESREMWLTSRDVRRSFTILRSAVSVLWQSDWQTEGGKGDYCFQDFGIVEGGQSFQ